jgi:hypothetical protein
MLPESIAKTLQLAEPPVPPCLGQSLSSINSMFVVQRRQATSAWRPSILNSHSLLSHQLFPS